MENCPYRGTSFLIPRTSGVSYCNIYMCFHLFLEYQSGLALAFFQFHSQRDLRLIQRTFPPFFGRFYRALDGLMHSGGNLLSTPD
jgi:hypothetical protein